MTSRISSLTNNDPLFFKVRRGDSVTFNKVENDVQRLDADIILMVVIMKHLL